MLNAPRFTSFLPALLLAACQPHPASTSAQVDKPAGATAFYADTFSRRATVPEMTALGRKLFFDAALSASGKLACASCHDPQHAYGPADDAAVHLGGGQLDAAGVRAVPSLRYVQDVPSFAEHFFEEGSTESEDAGPTGGHTWDGRESSAHDQARLPLLSPAEKANTSADAIVAKLEHGPLAAQFRAVYGADVFGNHDNAFKGLLKALEVFQQDPHEFYPYSSRYDDWLRGTGKLSAQEMRGLALFNDERKGNCTSCHQSQIKEGAFPHFTDFGFVALGVPRNAAIPANRDASWHDLGLCGPFAHRSCGTQGILRPVPRTATAQRGAAQGVLPQWPVPRPAPGSGVLREPRPAAGALVQQGRERSGAALRRPAGRVSRQHQPRTRPSIASPATSRR